MFNASTPFRILRKSGVSWRTFCAATIGRMSLPELKRQGYDESMMIGTLTGSGTLGILIPPSITMVVYAVAADASIMALAPRTMAIAIIRIVASRIGMGP